MDNTTTMTTPQVLAHLQQQYEQGAVPVSQSRGYPKFQKMPAFVDQETGVSQLKGIRMCTTDRTVPQCHSARSARPLTT